MTSTNPVQDAPPALPGTFEGLLLLRAVQLAEQAQPLDDVLAMREAHAQFSRPQDRLFRRAVLLAPQLGLDQELAHWRGWLMWVSLVCAVLVALLSYGLIGAVIGGDRSINALGALAAVLGPHFVSLTLWLIALAVGADSGGLPRWILSTSTQLPGFKRRSSRLLLDAGLSVLGQQRRLLSWAFGTMMHAIWALAFILTLMGLVSAFSFFAFRLTWETTILSPEVLARFAQISGSLPRLIGFATPDVAHVLSGAGDHRGWALWLIACTLVYGLGLRALVGAISATMLWRTLGQLRVDTQDPYIRKLMQRFESLNAWQLVDAEHATPKGSASVMPGSPSRSGWAVIGFELPPDLAWPPAWAAGNRLVEKTDGSAASKRATLAQLRRVSPERLIVICNSAASPDRATERFIREATSFAGATALLLLGNRAEEASVSAKRWLDWLPPLALDQVFNDSPDAAVKWAKEDHGQGH
ncbi:DUF2868 domain-containing protein [Rhodoferax sp.]|uniref:DUF2868 domain-containing protein n=1 Tax=Rhodoferax sp. TaxID=50421 RepID=UPI0019FCBFB9|nr:DUF2868 domain-containing protein [Rhodoferax sp.]MBE0473857.1 DUF2868 domain-containing protein [Rhodoferax sp.]